MDGDGQVLRAVEHEIGQQIVVPHPHDLENADRDHRGPQHRQHDGEVRAQRAAAVDGGRLLNFKRDGFDKADEHENRKPRAKAEVDDGDGPGGIELEGIGRLRQCEHHHLERHDHRKDAEIIDHAAEFAVHTRDVPRGHRRAEQNQRGRDDGDK